MVGKGVSRMKRDSRKKGSGKQQIPGFMVSRCQEHRERVFNLCREAFRGRRDYGYMMESHGGPDPSLLCLNVALRVSPIPGVEFKYFEWSLWPSTTLRSPSLSTSSCLPLHTPHCHVSGFTPSQCHHTLPQSLPLWLFPEIIAF